MTCDEVREQLMALEPSAFDGVAHLATCEACRSFAAELRAMDAAVAAQVEAFARGGDFDAEWEQALRAAGPRPRRWLRPGPGVGLTAVAMAAAALLALRLPRDPAAPPAPDVPEVALPLPSPPAESPSPPEVAATPPAPEAAPAPPPPPPSPPRPSPSVPRSVGVRPAPAAPATVTAPDPPAPPPVVATRPATSPRATDPAAAPPPPAVAPMEHPGVGDAGAGRSRSTRSTAQTDPPTGWITVSIDPEVPGLPTVEVRCGSTTLQRPRGDGTIRLPVPADGRCRVSFPGTSLREGVQPGGSVRVVLHEGEPRLIRGP